MFDRLVKAAHDRRRGGDEPARAGLPGRRRLRRGSEQLLRRYFAAYEILTSLEGVQTERAENAARVRFRANMSGQPLKVGGLSGLLPSSASYDFDLRLARDGKAWKVAWAQWTPAS
jgi:hypothetical protein